MARVPSGSSNHHIHKVAPDDYEVSWTVNYKAAGSRLLIASRRRRYTDEKGARRFAKKWKIAMPDAA